MKQFPGRLAIQQRVLPTYRTPFFNLLSESCQGGLSLMAGSPRPEEGIMEAGSLEKGHFSAVRNIHFSKPSFSTYLCWQVGVVRWLEHWKPDILIVEANPRILSTRQAIIWMHQRRRPVLGWGLGVPRAGSVGENQFRVRFLRSLDGVISYSNRGTSEYQNLGLENVFTAYNAVSRKPLKAPLDRPLSYIDKPRVLFVGRLQERKRLDLLLQACRDLPARLQPILTIIGDGPAKVELENLALIEYPDAIFVGAKHGESLNPYYEWADLFVLPGTGGLAVQQAMAYGLPIVVAQGDGTQDDLVRPENGWQVPPGDLAALTETLVDALSDVARLRKMGTVSYRITSEEVNLEAMVESFIQALITVNHN
jgi:glycosyltransferase involved in cell wall biosynthesis